MALPQRKSVGVPCGEIADVEPRPGEAGELGDFAFAQEAIGNAALSENLDTARVQAPGPRAREVLAGAALEDGDVAIGERQLRRQHQSGRAAAGDHDGMVGRLRRPGLPGAGARV